METYITATTTVSSTKHSSDVIQQVTTEATKEQTSYISSRSTDNEDLYPLDLNVVIPIVVCLITVLMVLFALRARLERTSWYQNMVSTMNRRTQQSPISQDVKNGPQFDFPPDYAIALHMPKPSEKDKEEDSRVSGDELSNTDMPNNSAILQPGTREISSSSSTLDTQVTASDVSVSILEADHFPDCDLYHIRDRGMCDSKITSENNKDAKTLTRLSSFFAEHLHKMVYNPASPSYDLPSYREYIDQLPSVHHI